MSSNQSSIEPGLRRCMSWQQLVMLVALVVLCVYGLTLPSSRGSYNDLGTLESSVQRQAQEVIAVNPSTTGLSVYSVVCIPQVAHKFVCRVAVSDGSDVSVTVTVSSDGTSYVTN